MPKVIVVFSPKGGVGKTLIAVNLAVSLAREQMKRVCLIDLDLQVVGDMARMLGLKPQKAMVDLLHLLSKKPDSIRKEDFLSRYSDGLSFLPGVLKPQSAPNLDARRIPEVLNLFAKDYDYIVIDGGQSFNDILISALNRANLILLVITPDILSVYQTKWTLDTLQSLHFPLKMIKVVLNRAESISSISWQEIKAVLPCDIIAHIPSEGKTVMQAVNRGLPVVIDAVRSRFAVSINKLVAELIKNEEAFVEYKEIDELRLEELNLQRTGEFWERMGLTEQLLELGVAEKEDEVISLKQQVHQRLIDELQLKRLDINTLATPLKIKELREKAEKIVVNLLIEVGGKFISSQEVRKKLVTEIIDEALGLGPLEDLLHGKEITDIMVNNKNEVYIERKGKIELTPKKFISNDQVKTIIERIIAPIGRHIDESIPMVDARLPDGSRVNAIIPPLSLTGPTLTIRKFRKEKFEIDELIGIKSLNFTMSEFIKACVLSRKNIIVSGGTGSGKTTVLNILSEFIPENERIITIEDAAELKLHQQHWIRLESRPPNIEGRGSVTIRDLFRNTLRMRPDRIIIGECRGIETLDMLQAMNTGHDGSMTTIHANSTRDVLARLDSMILMSGVELPVRAIREMIASAIDVIIHTSRLSDGSRKIIQISEIAGMKDEMHVELKDIFTYKQLRLNKKGTVLGDFCATGYIPSFIDDIRVRGIVLPDNTFAPPQ